MEFFKILQKKYFLVPRENKKYKLKAHAWFAVKRHTVEKRRMRFIEPTMSHSWRLWHNVSWSIWCECAWVRWRIIIYIELCGRDQITRQFTAAVSRCISHKVYGTMAMGISLFASTWFKALLAAVFSVFPHTPAKLFYCAVDEFNWTTPTMALLVRVSFYVRY